MPSTGGGMEITLKTNTNMAQKKRLWLRRGKLFWTAVTFTVAALAVLSFAFIKNTDNHGDFTPESNGEAVYPSLFYHYTGFDEDPAGAIKLTWKKTNLRLNGETAQIHLGVRIFPITLDDKRVTYHSADENIATVDESGMITALKPGKVNISATLEKSGQTATAELDVIRPVTSVAITNSTIKMNLSDPLQRFEVIVSPEDATNKEVIWTVQEPKVATVDENGTVHPVGKGTTEVTATTKDGGIMKQASIIIEDKTIPVESVHIQNKGSATMGVGESVVLIGTALPNNAKNNSITWSSSNSKVARISKKKGKLKALAEGTTIITAKSSNGKTDTMELTVDKSSGDSVLNLNGKVTSDKDIPTDILGNTYVANGTRVADGQTTYTSYDITLSEIVSLQMGLNPPPKIWRDGGSVSATESETTEYMDPGNYYAGAYKYQFLDLSCTNGVSADALNRFLQGKGILEGQGQAFVDAANESGVSEVYLVAHACLETGNGTSTLARGVSVNGTTVYNMFGIGAYDNSAVSSGSKRAYDQGWTSPEAAIRGGAAWISQWYINASPVRQNTLYKMLWNPESPGEHQYATDIGWAVKQAVSIEQIFAYFPEAVLSYDIPVYQGQTAITIQ